MSKSICILVDSLSSGGAERVAANLSISLTNRGYQVTLVSMRNQIDYPYKGALFNFGKIKEKHNKIQSFNKFKSFFKETNFDVVIDHRVRANFVKEYIFSKYVFNRHKVIYCVHSYDLSYYFSLLKWPKLSLLPHVEQKYFVCVSEFIQLNLSEQLNLKCTRIYNYVQPELIFNRINDLNKKKEIQYIIGVGRLMESKQFDVLISCYLASNLIDNNIKLIILGSGSEKEKLESLISDLKLENHVELISFKKNPYPLIMGAKCLVSSSRVEGFPMVLVEALILNVPVISYNYKSGPNEIIKNNVNGILVENQNQEQLTLALNKLLLDASFYDKIKSNTQLDLGKFSEDQIVQEWINLLENQM